MENDEKAQDQAVKELANQAHSEPGSKEHEEARERRAAAEAELTKHKKQLTASDRALDISDR